MKFVDRIFIIKCSVIVFIFYCHGIMNIYCEIFESEKKTDQVISKYYYSEFDSYIVVQ